MEVIKSRYTTSGQTWAERATAMRLDLQYHEFSYLFFKVALSMNEAKENADYDRYSICQQLAVAVERLDEREIAFLIDELERAE